MSTINTKTLRHIIKKDYSVAYPVSHINDALCQLGLQTRMHKADGFCRYIVAHNCPHGHMEEGPDYYAPRWERSVIPLVVRQLGLEPLENHQ